MCALLATVMHLTLWTPDSGPRMLLGMRCLGYPLRAGSRGLASIARCVANHQRGNHAIRFSHSDASDASQMRSSWSIAAPTSRLRSEEHTSELQSLRHLVCRLLL